MNALDVLQSRGLIKQCTDPDGLRRAFDAGPVVFYVGFDPTASSLHIGSLVPIMTMAWLQRLGHRPIVVHGGGTAMIGDPSGKDKSRELLGPAQIGRNLVSQRAQFARFLDLIPAIETPPSIEEWTDTRGILRDNGDWLLPLNYIDFLRDIGRHFSINHMLTAEGTQQRLERGQGLSFIEFNYHLLQSYDYLHLHRAYACNLQIGGDDQWFHIVGGCDLIRRELALEGRSADVFGLTLPLLMTADGKKMGKTEAGAVWLDPDQLSPYHYYQYWVNVHDQDVGRFLRLFTFLEEEQIKALEQLGGADVREAKRVLALEATALCHGREAAEAAAAAATAAFSGGVSEAMPSVAVSLPALLVDVLVSGELAKSRSDARRHILGGSVSIDGDKITDISATVGAECVVWLGKKRAVRVTAG